MIDPKKVGWLIGLIIALLATWLWMRPAPTQVTNVSDELKASTNPPPVPQSVPTPIPTGPIRHVPVNPVAAKLNDPALTAKDDVYSVHQLLTQMFGVWKSGARPMSLNAEFTRALTGDNPMRLPFVQSDHPAIINGKLTDRWDQPYQFHILSMDRIEVRSGGPDHQLYTEDDVIFSPWTKQPPTALPADNVAGGN